MSIERDIQATVDNNPYSNRVDIRMCSGRGENVAAAQSVIFSPAAEGTEWAPMLSLSRTEAQALFDEFIRAGFKPSHQVIHNAITMHRAQLSQAAPVAQEPPKSAA